jgi:hypothetical protein
MAKPRELYNGPAPQAMSLMGAGIADAYANVGRIHGEGYKAMGAGIAQGITAAASAYAGYKQQQSQAKAYEGFLNNELGQKALGINAETAKGYIKAAKDMGGPAAQIQFYEMGIPSLMKSNLGLQEQLKLVGARAGAESGLIDKRFSNEASLAGINALLGKGVGASGGTSMPTYTPAPTPAFSPQPLDLRPKYSWEVK